MSLRIYNTLSRALEAFRPIEPGHVRMYVCGMTVYDLLPHRPCAHDDGVRRGAALAARRSGYASPTCATSPTSTTRSSSARSRTAMPIRALTDAHDRGDARGRRRARHRAARPRAARHRIRAADARHDRRARATRAWPTGPTNGDVNYAVRKLPRLRQALGQVARRAARRRARRGARRQARPARLRAVEGGQAERAGGRQVGQRRRRRAGPGWHIECSAMCVRAARRDLRHPRRRRGPAVPAPRERDRAERRRHRRAVRATTGCTTASSTSTTRRCRSRWATSSPSAKCSQQLRRRDACASSSLRAHYRSPLELSATRISTTRAARCARLYTALDGSTPAAWPRSTGPSRTRRASARRWTTTSTRPRRWPCCSSWPARSTARGRAALAGAAARRSARRSACCSATPRALPARAGAGVGAGDRRRHRRR